MKVTNTMLLMAVLLILTGCCTTITDSEYEGSMKEAMADVFASIDKDGNGTLSYEEYRKSPEVKDEYFIEEAEKHNMGPKVFIRWTFDQSDKNKDKQLSLNEWMGFSY